MNGANAPETANVFVVSQVNKMLKKHIEGASAFRSIYVKGEISNLTIHTSGHFYFSLKDSGSVLKCIMFRSAASKILFAPENGLKVICHGRIAVYEQGGNYQLNVDRMKPDGVGERYVAFEQLKKKLLAAGVFDKKYKKPLPRTPYRVGIVTSPTGAAVRDIIKIGRRRFPPAKLILYPALVQGDGAAESVIKGIEFFNRTRMADVLIIGRGGGSIEDLWAFNDENLAMAIFRSEIPIISAVGHETDFTISDFVADVRAATPSDAALLCLPEIETYRTRLKNVVRRLCDSQNANIAKRRAELSLLQNSKPLTSPLNTLFDRRTALTDLEGRLHGGLKLVLSNRRTEARHMGEKLELLNPYAPLNRGYAIAFGKSGAIYGAKELTEGDVIRLKFADGEASAVVNDISVTEK